VLVADLYDARYHALDQASIRAELRDPFGTSRDVTFQEELANPGTYTAPFVPRDEGVYEVSVSVDRNGTSVGTATHSFLVRSSRKEFHDATLKRSFLESIAQANAGVYYDAREASAIAPALRTRRTSSSVYRSEYLWDMPLLFGVVLVLLTAEWLYRRRKGLP
jgi:hypothetical protein